MGQPFWVSAPIPSGQGQLAAWIIVPNNISTRIAFPRKREGAYSPPAEQNSELYLEKGRGLHPLQTRRRLLGADAYSKAGTAGRGSAAKAPPELLLKVGSHQKDGIHALKARTTLSHQHPHFLGRHKCPSLHMCASDRPKNDFTKV